MSDILSESAAYYEGLKIGIKCKACGANLNLLNDPELCSECMAVVYDLISDLDPMDMEEFIEPWEEEEEEEDVFSDT